jgi:hypothetical protein
VQEYSLLGRTKAANGQEYSLKRTGLQPSRGQEYSPPKSRNITFERTEFQYIYTREEVWTTFLGKENVLCIHLDELLSFDHHTRYLCSKLNKSLYCINKSKNFLTPKALKTLYYSLVHSHLSYCTPILGCASNTNIQHIFKIQKKPSE